MNNFIFLTIIKKIIYIIYLILGVYYEEIILIYFGRLQDKKFYLNSIKFNLF